MESLNGEMEENTKESGLKVNNMELGYTEMEEEKRKEGLGSMEEGQVGYDLL